MCSVALSASLAEAGATLDWYIEKLQEQGGVCAICYEPCATGGRLSVDHDHGCCPGRKSCGKCLRGLLCRRCNIDLGGFGDDPELLYSAADYLDDHQS